jgi:hypothetical protein
MFMRTSIFIQAEGGDKRSVKTGIDSDSKHRDMQTNWGIPVDDLITGAVPSLMSTHYLTLLALQRSPTRGVVCGN